MPHGQKLKHKAEEIKTLKIVHIKKKKKKKLKKKSCTLGNSLEVQDLGHSAFTALVRVQSLVGELRSCKLCSVAKK